MATQKAEAKRNRGHEWHRCRDKYNFWYLLRYAHKTFTAWIWNWTYTSIRASSTWFTCECVLQMKYEKTKKTTRKIAFATKSQSSHCGFLTSIRTQWKNKSRKQTTAHAHECKLHEYGINKQHQWTKIIIKINIRVMLQNANKHTHLNLGQRIWWPQVCCYCFLLSLLLPLLLCFMFARGKQKNNRKIINRNWSIFRLIFFSPSLCACVAFIFFVERIRFS